MKFLVAVLNLILTAAAAQADYVYRTAVSGKTLKLDFIYSMNPDCTAVGDPTVRITQAPQHGRVQITKSQDFPNIRTTSALADCGRRRISGAVANYVSEKGYLGSDYLTIEAILPNGRETARSYTITVK